MATLPRSWILVLLISLALASAAGSPQEKKVDIDEEYVKANLKDYLQADRFEFLAGGRVKFTFLLYQTKREVAALFEPNIGKRSEKKNRFRWSPTGGILVGDRGTAYLNCWFKDDVEAELQYVQYRNYLPRQTASLIFGNEKGLAVGNNFGTQCVAFSKKGKLTARKGEVDPALIGGSIPMKLVVRGGVFKAYTVDYERAKMSYPEEKFSSGRIGFRWGGPVVGQLTFLQVTGRIDARKMAALIQKARK